ncbi:hypothetical protein FB45DRAFT_1062986 [Roridomyces roridus]|uniref:F-box domain-containing protein n=1 Tax=Roridomyces roridus TaxID=1738132 RepID=A0AAD7BFV4_9AGAR|nr:hypothetical protein FB45DRAFT_1062986 [Roridomyces roridus]
MWLPNEVLTEIIQNAPRADQTTLCRVSKLFHELVLPILLKKVAFSLWKSRPGALEAFCRTMIRNPARADSARSLTFLNISFDDFPAKGLLIECLKLMRQLEHFCIRDFRPLGVGSCLANLDLPNLWSCTLEFHAESWELHVAKFLTRHPTITHLRLYMWTLDRDEPLPQGTLLPRLQYYHGQLHLLGAFSKQSLVAVQTSWMEQAPSLIEKLGPNLASLSIDSFFAAQIPDAIIHLSTHMSQLEKLQLHCSDARATAAMANDINAYLPRFKRLAYLVFMINYNPQGKDSLLNSDIERGALAAWETICPTLRGCCTGRTAWRKVGEKWEECGMKVLHAEAGFALNSNEIRDYESDPSY